MTAIQDLPSARDFGYDFNYSLWTAGTVVTLCNVPWNSDYRDVVRFADQAGLDTFIDDNSGPTVGITGMTHARFGHPVRISLPFNAAQNFNYLRAYNPAQPTMDNTDTGKAFYYFVTDVRYIAPNVTELNIQVDVWQTFGYGVTFGNCYIERGHVGIANENSFDDYGREFLTIPEGMDIGGEYEIVDQWKRHIASAKPLSGSSDPNYSIMVTSTVSLTSPPGTTDAPLLVSAAGSDFERLPNGASMYLFDTLADFKEFMFLYADKPWITSGIISITAIPTSEDYGIMYDEITVGEIVIKELKGSMFNQFFNALKVAWRDDLPIPERYAGLLKLKTFPYTVLEMTSYTGTPLVIKPESWANPDAIVLEIPHFAPPSARLMFVPYRYNAKGPYDPTMADLFDEYGTFNDGGEFLDMATGISNFPTFSTVNNGYQMFMASNHNSVAFQHTSAEWSQQRAMQGASTAYDQASSGIEASKSANVQGISAASQSVTLANETAGWNALQAGGNAVLGGVGNGAAGVVSAARGAANAGVDYAIGINQRNQSLGIQNNLSEGVNRTQTQNSGFVRDTNRSLAEFSAKGDYSNTIAGIQAKVQDARLIQPTTSGQVGGEAFNLATYKWGYDVKVKMINGAAMNAVGEFMLRYGYAINRFGRMPSSFQVMEKFTYWKLRETYIQSASCPESFKQALRGIFEKGVTVWNDPTDIGMIDIADNAPLTGVTL